MKLTRCATKVVQDEDTNEISSGFCAFLWEDVVGMEDCAGTKFDWPQPRTWVWLHYAAFYIECEPQAFFKEWQAYLASTDHTVAFSRS